MALEVWQANLWLAAKLGADPAGSNSQAVPGSPPPQVLGKSRTKGLLKLSDQMPFYDKALRKEEAEIKGEMGGRGEADLTKCKVVLRITSQRQLRREADSPELIHPLGQSFLYKTSGPHCWLKNEQTRGSWLPHSVITLKRIRDKTISLWEIKAS